jgi:hypothetical protein
MVLCLAVAGAVLFAFFGRGLTQGEEYWPLLLVLLCPVLHFVMHHNHGLSQGTH